MMTYLHKQYRISASEIAQFHFCPMSWYLRKQGFIPASKHFRSGKLKHKQIGHLVQRSNHLKKMSIILGLTGTIFIVLSIFLFFLQVIIP